MSAPEIRLLEALARAGCLLDSDVDPDVARLLLARGCIERSARLPEGLGYRLTDLGRIALADARAGELERRWSHRVAIATLIVAIATLIVTAIALIVSLS